MITFKLEKKIRCYDILGGIGQIFNPPDLPQLPTIYAPKRSDAVRKGTSLSEAEKLGLLRRRLGISRSDTILTSGAGDTSAAPVQRVTLLGGTQ